MRARYYDGEVAVAYAAEAAVESGALVFEAAGARHSWPLAEIEAEEVGASVRLARPPRPARLVVDAGEWRAATPDPRHKARPRGKELKLVAGLTAAAASLALLVFVGIPAASGPLARMTPPAFERAMGDSFEAQLALAFKPCRGQAGQDALLALGDSLESGAKTPFNLRVQAVDAPMVNAFALPGGAILVTDDLIEMADTPDELAAVIAHEAAHVEKRHVMQAVWRSLGLGLILDAVVGGGTGAGQQAVLLAGSFADLRYSREAELEADARGQEILQDLRLSSEGMGTFFERLSVKAQGAQAAAVEELISTHPDTARRARLSRARARPGDPAFGAADWAAIKAACKDPKQER